MKTSSVKRFTLIELLVVIAIIGILAGLVFPALGTVRNNAKKTKASSECHSLKAAITLYESEFSCWPANASGSNDVTVTGGDYVEMCKILTGKNAKKMVFYEVGVGFDENKGVLDPWGRPYQVVLDANYDGQISSSVQVVSAMNTVNNRSGNLRSPVAVYSFGVSENDNNSSDVSTLAKKKKLVTSW